MSVYLVRAPRVVFSFFAVLLALAVGLGSAVRASALEVTALTQSIAEAASGDPDLAAFYRARDYRPVWTDGSADARARRQALLVALDAAGDHGLPPYETGLLRANMRQITSDRDLGRVEVELSRLFLEYARDVQTGVLVPSRVDSGIVRQVPYRDRLQTLTNFTRSTPAAYLRQLPPSSPEYARLMREKLRLETVIAQGGWGGTVPAGKFEPGDAGAGVVALRNRLIHLGYLPQTARVAYDERMRAAVQTFQRDTGLAADGVAGPSTIEELNRAPQDRLASIIVAMERERWINMPRGERHIWVNLTDFSAKIYDDDKVTFETRSVVGANSSDRRSPEFSDSMDHMVINPTWNVPRSIAVNEYLPQMQQNPAAAGYLRLIDSRGRVVPRSEVDFTQFTPATFPFDLKQPPSNSNALGLVKFMFPNRYNIYLHDTPQKSLFGREVRAFSHGCIRLNDPFDFAYVLLARQTSDPEGFFRAKLNTGVETYVPLEQEVPVHLVYRTAISKPKGGMEYRRDVYGRDGRIWSALQQAGVQLRMAGG